MIILGGSYYNGPKSIFTGTAIIKDVNKIVLQNGIYDRLYVSNDISKQEIVDTYTSEAAQSVKIESGINRIETIDVYGKTTQEGTGDASPNNVRPIQNAGKFNKIAVIDGTTGVYIRTVENGFVVANISGISDVTKNSKVVSTYLKAFSFEDETTKEGIRAFSASSGFAISIKQSKLTGTDESAVKAYFSAHPLTVGYQSTEDTGEYYTGLAVQQNGAYRCEIIRLADRLHAGGTLETNVQSEYDAYAEFDGSSDENWLLDSGSTAGADGSKRMWIKLTGPQTENTSDTAVPVAASNQLTAQSAETTYIAKAANCFDVVCSGAINMLHVRIAGISTVEALKTHLQSHPLRVFYKSASGGAGKNVRRETHVKKTLVLDGDKVKFTKNSSYWNLTYYTTPNISSTPRCICNAFPGNIFYSNRTYFFIFVAETAMLQYFESPDACNTFLSEQYAAGTPVTIEYELAQPEVFTDEPVIVENKAGEYTVSFESTGRVKLKPVINQEGWSDDTIIDAGFNGDLAGGNVDFTAESIDKIRIKRRKKGTANWVDLKDITINVPDDFTFTFYDLFAANAAEYTYAVVPVIGDIEGNLSTADIQSMFNGFFIADKNTIYGTEYNVNVGAATKNEKSSVVQTLGAKYPFIIDNGYNNYYTVPISLFFYNPNLDWQQNVQYRQTIVEWLHNGTAKIFKSEDGRIWLAKVTTAPVLTPGSNLNITSIDFSITEIGESNSTEDLYNSGLLSLIKES